MAALRGRGGSLGKLTARRGDGRGSDTDEVCVRPAGGKTWRVVGWAILGALAAFTALRLAQPSSSAVVYAVALTPWWYVAAWPVLAVAAHRRLLVMAFSALALVGAQVLLALPARHPWVTAAPAVGPWRLSIFDANVRYTNDDLDGIGREVASDRSDVVTLEELSTLNVSSFAKYATAYPWRYVHATGSSTGFGVWSRIPLQEAHLVAGVGSPVVEATLLPAGQLPVHLLIVHTVAPVGAAQFARWRAELRAIGRDVANIARPAVVIGDFNATSDMRQFQDAAGNMKDAAAERGQGWRSTWSRDWSVLPPLLRIDHALYSSDLTATSYRLGKGVGSDHRPLLVGFGSARS